MRRDRVPSWFRATSTGAALLGVLFLFGCAEQGTSPTSPEGDLSAAFGEAGPPQELGPALAAQEAHSDRLMALRDVVGTAVGVAEDGEGSLVVYVTRPGPRGVPAEVDGVQVEKVVTGLIVAGADPTSRARPAPVGFSVGHPDITAGTYGAKVKDGSGNAFMLSNNHVLANSNDASIGDATLQPGPSDGGSDPADRIGTLADYEPIDFSNDNVMDAAITSPTYPDSISASTPGDAYGTPGTTVTDATVGMNVQKYGRTTGLTTGTVEEVSVTISVCYEPAGPFMCKQAATFVDQIGIGPGTFSDGGDSGSLIVTDDSNADPVGLLFAGGSDRTFANPIGAVFNRFGVSIDDGSDGGTTNSPPTASFTSSCTDLSCDFDGSGSSDSDGSISSYEWDFGDGNTATGQTASHTYGSDGTYTVTLTVTDDDGATDSSSQDVTVSSSDTNSPPTSEFTHSCSDLSCDFDGSGSSDSDGSISSYEWDFGDGNTGSGETTSHTYASGGTYTVTLTVTDDDGATDSSSQDVTVEEATSGLSLSADGYKVRGQHQIDLTWSGATSTDVDIYLDGVLLTTTANDGAYTHSTNNRGPGSYTFEVCEAGTSTCSNSVTVTF